MPKLMRIVLAFILLCCAAALAPAQSVAELVASGGRIRGLVVPIFDKEAMTNLAVIRIERVYTGHERKGFFQIGLLPMEILEGVTIQVSDPARLAKGFERVNRWMTPKKSERLELRNARIEVGAQWLEAKRIIPGENGVWDMQGGVVFSQGTNIIRSPQGKLQLAGLHAGTIALVTDTNQYSFYITATNN